MKPANSKTALLVIDITNGCASPRCEIKKWGITFKKIRKMVPSLVAFIKTWKKHGLGPVIFVNCTKWDKKHLAKNIVELYKDPNCCYYSEDKTGFSEKFYKVKPERRDYVIIKNHYDAFTSSQLVKILKKRKIKYLAVAGIFGDGCVDATIKGGFSKGYNFIILKDLIETSDVKVRQGLQKLLKQHNWPKMYGKTITSNEFLKQNKI